MESVPRDWQADYTTFNQRSEYLLQTGQWSDCTFLVGTGSNQVVVAGHKLILAMVSPVFEAMFYGAMAEKNEPIAVDDIEIDIFKALLKYIYTSNITISTIEEAFELYYVARKYIMPHLVKRCIEFLSSNLQPSNVCRVYEFACWMEENDLMKKCIRIIRTNTKAVLKNSSFEEVELETVIAIFSSHCLYIHCELELFEALLRYAKAMEKRKVENTTPPTEEAPVNEIFQKSIQSSTTQVDNIDSGTESNPDVMDAVGSTKQKYKTLDTKEKPSIRSAVEKIRFLRLSPQQFAQGPARSLLLSESETLHILMHILDPNTDIPFPPGFSTCTRPRKNHPCLSQDLPCNCSNRV